MRVKFKDGIELCRKVKRKKQMLAIITTRDKLRYIDCKTAEKADELYEKILVNGFIDVSKIEGWLYCGSLHNIGVN